jgi:uncharacterized surface protein with fasciclin (FAS1) repeats
MKRLLKTVYLTFFLMLILSSCKEKFDPYNIPPFLGGSIIETLKKEGNYTILLELSDRAGYTETIESDVYILFAANDSAFKVFFAERGIKSVGDLSLDECRSLMSMVTKKQPYSRFQLIYRHSHDKWEGPESEYLSLFYRWPTSEAEYPIQKEVVKYNTNYLGEELNIRGDIKNVPVYSEDYFGDYGGDPKGSDYLYFFPNSTWRGLQWFNAGVIGPEARCSNGFIYYIDQVVPVPPSIDQYLRSNKNKYGVFYDLMDRFATYSSAGGEYIGTEFVSYYNKGYSGVKNIASEAGAQSLGYELRNVMTIYLPTDNVFNEYLNKTFLTTFESIDSVPLITIQYLLNGHIDANWILPSIIRKEFLNPYGEKIDFDLDKNVTDTRMLSNGALYEINKVLEPLAFKAVPGPLFYNKNYTTFLRVLNQAQKISTVSFYDVPVTVFAPDNEMLMKYGYRYDKYTEALQKRNIYGVWAKMDQDEINNLADDHIIFRSLEDLSFDGIIFMSSGTGVQIKNNILVAGGNREANEQIGVIKAINSNINGVLYLLDAAIKAPKEDFARYIFNNNDFSELYALLNKAKLVDEVYDKDDKIYYKRLKFLNQYEHWTGFLPDNDAITNALANNLIPQDTLELVQFLKYHFVGNEVITDYQTVSNDYATASVSSTGALRKLNIQSQPKQMVVTDGSGKTVQIDHNTANEFVSDGIAHRIKTVLISN